MDEITAVGLLPRETTRPVHFAGRCRLYHSPSRWSFHHRDCQRQPQDGKYRTSCKLAHSVAELQPVRQGRPVNTNLQEQKRLQTQLQQILKLETTPNNTVTSRQFMTKASSSNSTATPRSSRPVSRIQSKLTVNTCGSDVELSDLLDKLRLSFTEKHSFNILQEQLRLQTQLQQVLKQTSSKSCRQHRE